MAQARALQRLGQLLGQIPALIEAVEIGRIAAASLDARQRGQRCLQASQCRHRRLRPRRDLLRKIEHLAGTQAAPGAGLQQARQHARQHRLARAIAPDQPGRAQVEVFVEIGKQRSAVRQNAGHAFQREKGIRHVSFQGCQELPLLGRG